MYRCKYSSVIIFCVYITRGHQEKEKRNYLSSKIPVDFIKKIMKEKKKAQASHVKTAKQSTHLLPPTLLQKKWLLMETAGNSECWAIFLLNKVSN